MTICCKIPGCQYYLPDAHEDQVAVHQARLHTSCGCGWVGVHLAGHLRQAIARGETMFDHPAMVVEDLPRMFDPDDG